MYTYYALKAMRVYIPRWVSMFITSCQLLQMVMGIISNMAALYYLEHGHQCATTHKDIMLAFALYATYLVLFAHFFYKAYIRPRPAKSVSKPQSNGHPNGHLQTNGHPNGKPITNGHHIEANSSNGINKH